jgi:hypothetical protein
MSYVNAIHNCRTLTKRWQTFVPASRHFCWHEMPDDGGWEYGANLDYMQELCAYWLEEAYDWRKHEATLKQAQPLQDGRGWD